MSASVTSRSGTTVHLAADPLDPDEFLLSDVAWSLPALPRYNAHTEVPYSVGQHLTLASQIARELYPDDLALQRTALLHDAPEAWLGDMPGPLKRLPAMRPFVELELRVWAVVAEKFECLPTIPPEVHAIDRALLKVEMKHLFAGPALKVTPDEAKVVAAAWRLFTFPWGVDFARYHFVRELKALGLSQLL